MIGVSIKTVLKTSLYSFALILYSCSSRIDPDKQNYTGNQQFLREFKQLKESAFSQDVAITGETKAVLNHEDEVAIRVVLPVDEPYSSEFTPQIGSLHTLGDLVQIASDYAASLVIDDRKSAGSLMVSKSRVKNSLMTMISQSKYYLINQFGFDESEIVEMLDVENADESVLVPFVLAIIEHDNSFYLTSIQPGFSLFTPAMAVEWQQVGHCALRAIGADIFFGLGTSMCKTWGKKAIKTAFKTAAKRIVGPVGVAIAVIEFSLCMGGVEL